MATIRIDVGDVSVEAEAPDELFISLAGKAAREELDEKEQIKSVLSRLFLHLTQEATWAEAERVRQEHANLWLQHPWQIRDVAPIKKES